jgi:predicted nucleic-acid-binding protein
MPRRTPGAIVDTNVLLRFLLGDDPSQSPKASALFRRASEGKERLLLEDGVLAETIWVLEKYIKVPRLEIARQMALVIAIEGVQGTGGRRVILEALATYGRTVCDFVDCILAARSKARKQKVYTFDVTDFRRLDCDWQEPA